MRKLFLEPGEAQTKAKLYEAGLQTAGAEGAARVTSLVRRYASMVEGTLQQFGELVGHMEAANPEIHSSSLLDGFPTPSGNGEAGGSSEVNAFTSLVLSRPGCSRRVLEPSFLRKKSRDVFEP